MESASVNSLPAAERWELRFQYAFLGASTSSDPAAAQVSVFLVPEGGTPRELLRIDRLFTRVGAGARGTQLVSGGCGTTDRAAHRHGLVVNATYPVCTGGREAALDLGDAGSGPFRIRILAFEDTDGEPVAIAMDNMVIWAFNETP
jgi:hypothetical protein